MAQMVNLLPTMQETWFQSLGQEDPLEKEMATHSSLLPGKSHGQRSMVGYSPWGRKELDMTCERDGNTRPPDLPLEKPVSRSGSNS